MRSRNLLILTLLLLVIGASQAFSQATMSVTPAKVPTGAYVNGPEGTATAGNPDDNYFFQQINYSPSRIHQYGSSFTVDLPADMTLADINNDGSMINEVSTTGVNTSGTDGMPRFATMGVDAAFNTITFYLGNEVLTNGTFDDDYATGPSWTETPASANITYDNEIVTDADFGVVDFAAATNDDIVQTGVINSLASYRVSFKITKFTAGTIVPTVGGTAGGLGTYNAVGTYTETIVAGTGEDFVMNATGFTGTIDDITCVEISEPNAVGNAALTVDTSLRTPAWAFGGNWQWNAGEIDMTGAGAGAATLPGVVVNGGNYFLSFTYTNAANTVTPSLGGTAGLPLSIAGPVAYGDIILSAGTDLVFTADGTGNASQIDDIKLYRLDTTNLVTNGTFTGDATGWTMGTDWAYNANAARHVTGAIGILEQDISALPGVTYYLKYEVTNFTAGTSVTPSIGGAVGAAASAVGTYLEVLTATTTGNLQFTATADCNEVDIDNVEVYVSYNTFDSTDNMYAMFPVETAESPAAGTKEYIVDFIDATDNATDDLTTGSGPTITYVAPGPLAVGEVTFTGRMTGDNDSTLADGEIYPAVGNAAFNALPDYLVDSVGNTQVATTLPTEVTDNFDNADGDNTNDVVFRVYASQDSTLSHVDADDTGVVQMLTHTPSALTVNEGHTGNQGFTVANLTEGEWYFYVVSSITGDFPLGRSGKVTVTHWPQVDVLAWDYDASATLEAGDSSNMTIDSGLFVGINGVILPSVTPTDNVDFWVAVDDFDDDATVNLYYSTNSSYTVSDVTVSGADGNETITGLGTSTLIVAGLKENNEDGNGFIKYNWENKIANPLPAGTYTVYAVANDKKNQYVKPVMGYDNTNDPTFSGTTQLTISVKHSPDLVIDALAEYDLGVDSFQGVAGAADVTIDQSQTDVVMLSWGKSGIEGDKDIDNACTIEFYIDYDDTPALTDFGADDVTAIRTAAALAAGNTSTGTHKIVVDLLEDPEGKEDAYYAWNLKEDYLNTGWYPADESTNTNRYVIYGVISEGSGASLTERVVCLGISGVFDDGAAGADVISFNNTTPYVNVHTPPVSNAAMNANATYRIDFDVMDIDSNAEVGVFLVKEDAGEKVANGDFDNGATGYDFTAGDWSLTGGSASRTANATRLLAEFTTANIEYTVTFEISDMTQGEITDVRLGDSTNAANDLTGGPYTANGVYTETITCNTPGGGAGVDGLAFLPDAGALFDGKIDNISVMIGDGEYSEGASMVTIADISADNLADGDAYALTSTDGSLANGSWLTDNTVQYYDVQLRVPGAAAAKYTANLSTGSAVALADGDYYVYVGVNNDTTANPNFANGTQKLYRAPGMLSITGLASEVPQRNLMLEPKNFVSTIGDTTTVSVRAYYPTDVDIIELFVAVDTTYFEVVDASATPFTDPTGQGYLIANESTMSGTNYQLHATIFNDGDDIGLGTTGFGDLIATFQVVGKGTSSDIGTSSKISVIDNMTKFFNNGVEQTIDGSNVTSNVQPRGSIHGTLAFEGRVSAEYVVTFDLRERGSYEQLDDAVFIAANDGFVHSTQTIGLDAGDYAASGIQYKLNADGDFKLTNVPTGEWDLVVKYDRYLAKLASVAVTPGDHELSYDFGELLGGDAYGYSDENSDVYPNNVIDQDDIDRIETAFATTSSDAKWDTEVDSSTGGKYNYKWADINENNVVDIDDLSLATGNFDTATGAVSGAQPVFAKAAEMPMISNLDATFEIVNLPDMMKAGERYTAQVIVRNAADISAYDLTLGYSSAISVNDIVKGSFISEESHSFPIFEDGIARLENSVYGAYSFKGDGVLAEVSFTSNRDGAFTSDMLAITGLRVVGSSMIGEDIVISDAVSVDAVPTEFTLKQNFPNPFNPTTTIAYSIPSKSNVELKIYDVLGRHIATLNSGIQEAGNYSIVWNARDDSGNMVSNGMYFYTITAGQYKDSRRMLFLK